MKQSPLKCVVVWSIIVMLIVLGVAVIFHFMFTN
jgi:hypothetical protein